MAAAHQSYLRSHDYRLYVTRMMLYDVSLLETLAHHGELDEPGSPLTLGEREAALAHKIHEIQQAKRVVQGVTICDALADQLNIATLFHVTEPMLAVAMAAADKLDAAEKWELETLPSRDGFLVFERPLYHLDARGAQTACAAMSWHVYTRIDGSSNVEVVFYAPADDPHDAYAAGLPHINLGPFHFASTGAVPFGLPVGPMELGQVDVELLDEAISSAERIPGLSAEEVNAEMGSLRDVRAATADEPLVGYPVRCINLYRVLFAIFLLMEQTVVSLETETDRKLQRRNRNRNGRPPANVVVIRLRRPDSVGRYDDDGVWKMSYRAWTRAHWRRVHTRDGIKRVWVLTYLRGPANAPIVHPSRVTTLER
jgi:hypothetical protein